MQRKSIMSQIVNFGVTPSQIFTRPHVQRISLEDHLQKGKGMGRGRGRGKNLNNVTLFFFFFLLISLLSPQCEDIHKEYFKDQ